MLTLWRVQEKLDLDEEVEFTGLRKKFLKQPLRGVEELGTFWTLQVK